LCIQPARDAVFYLLNWGEYHLVPARRRVMVVVILAAAALTLGLFIPKIDIVFSFLGSLVGGLLGFALPAVFFMRSDPHWSRASVGTGYYIATWTLLIAGLVAFVVGTVASVLNISGIS
jgi:predicted Co/Zn/Cd cation transporter (cation efflux family)